MISKGNFLTLIYYLQFNCFTYRVNLEGNRNIQLITEFSPLNIHFEEKKQKDKKIYSKIKNKISSRKVEVKFEFHKKPEFNQKQTETPRKQFKQTKPKKLITKQIYNLNFQTA